MNIVQANTISPAIRKLLSFATSGKNFNKSMKNTYFYRIGHYTVSELAVK